MCVFIFHLHSDISSTVIRNCSRHETSAYNHHQWLLSYFSSWSIILSVKTQNDSYSCRFWWPLDLLLWTSYMGTISHQFLWELASCGEGNELSERLHRLHTHLYSSLLHNKGINHCRLNWELWCGVLIPLVMAVRNTSCDLIHYCVGWNEGSSSSCQSESSSKSSVVPNFLAQRERERDLVSMTSLVLLTRLSPRGKARKRIQRNTNHNRSLGHFDSLCGGKGDLKYKVWCGESRKSK